MKKYLLEQVGIYKKNWVDFFDPKLVFLTLGIIPFLFIIFTDNSGYFKFVTDSLDYFWKLSLSFVSHDSYITQLCIAGCGLFLFGLVVYSLYILFISVLVLFIDLMLVITTGKTGEALRIHKLGLKLKRIQELEEKQKRGY